MEDLTDVLIVGAGPTGLLLAGDLAAAGVRCTVVEKRAEESNLSRAFAVHARTLEELDARGVADALVSTGTPVSGLRLFGGARLDLSGLPTRFPYVLVTPQYETEAVLERRARACGAEIRMGVEMRTLREVADGVEVAVRERSGDRRRIRARYVVGADGVRSAVRRALGLPFPGRAVVRSMVLADVRLGDPPTELPVIDSNRDAFAVLVPFGEGWYRVVAWDRRRQLPDDAPVALPEVREAMRRALGTDHGAHDARWMSRFHSDERQVERYRVGRVFLAGDAAHVHSPAGGQGMNVGLQDAANLGWKLAAVLQGRAPESLLDSYHTERHPVGRMAVRGSGALLRVALIAPRSLRVVRGTLGRVFTKVPPLAGRIAGAVSGIDIAYPRPPDSHPLTGRRAPDVPLADGRRLYEALRTGRFVLVTPPTSEAAATWADHADVHQAGGPTRHTVLVRPDAYIAWATAEPHPNAAVRRALTEHCGAPPVGVRGR
ncbi:FAD-dependent monooxygenase [Thermomonospora umbrina]|uniref:2-polyprenyl-6-methoxyphenol hydroxylase-like FAD-dependent oxidoreductase n=1 Tax=Thermomonospora umbrina TaxID=111806 RepID=A0A3D9SZ73_9ACTN|nr:FAD-dependent monooxygenase [Thermomonospora umbrina]REE96921.1 2-polyprenyl-6-methoxyphenol hydroxylase-like FAD-dependent oxidoreductase [Thermomonospora umbrina]